MNCRQNWSKKSEKELNKQISREYEASLSYHMLSNYFNRDDIGLSKLVEFFNKASLEEREHANKLMDYQNTRGGIVKLNSTNSLDDPENGPLSFILESPPENEYIPPLEKPNDIIDAFKLSLKMEKNINQHLLDLHKVAEEENDPQFCDYLEGEYLKEQVESISEFSKIVSVLERFNGDQHAIWNYIQHL